VYRTTEVDQYFTGQCGTYVTFHDDRDHFLPSLSVLPADVDLRQYNSPVLYETLGSGCVNAVLSMYENMLNQRGPGYSRAFSRRYLHHYLTQSLAVKGICASSSIRLSVAALKAVGVCKEEHMPYAVSTPPVFGVELCERGAVFRIKEYFLIGSLQEILNALSQNKPVAFAIHLDGIATAVMAVGFSRVGGYLICKTSQGSGHMRVSFEQARDCFDAFAIEPDWERVPVNRWQQNTVVRACDALWSWITA
jgi:hypothetical protein